MTLESQFFDIYLWLLISIPHVWQIASSHLLPPLRSVTKYARITQGDNSACSKPPVDIDLKVAF